LPFQVADLGDVGFDDHAVGAIALVELEDLRGGDAVGVPDDPGFHRRCRALHIARSDGQVPVLLRDLLDADIKAVLLENTGFLARVSGAKPVQPEMPTATLVSWAWAMPKASRANGRTSSFFMMASFVGVDGDS
jgi:hypothetical protein